MPYRFQNIQALRAVAASLVLLMHAFNVAATFDGQPLITSAMWAIRHVGHLGVDMFFVISGFIMVMVARRALDAAPSPAHAAVDFLRHRAFRIYPLFWITLAVFLTLPAVRGMPHDWLGLLRDPARLLLLVNPSEHAVAWTLVFEIYFYGIVALVMLFGRRHFGVAFCAAAVLLGLLLLANALTGFADSVFVVDRIALEFVIGAGVAAIISSGVRAGRRTAIAVGVALWIATVAIPPDVILLSGTRFLFWGIPAGLVLYGLVAAEQAGAALLPTWLRGLGDASYSLYMWHFPVLILLTALWVPAGWMGSLAGRVAYIAAGIALSVVVAKLSFAWIETPLMARRDGKRPAAGRHATIAPGAAARS